MSLVSKIIALAQAIGTDIKNLTVSLADGLNTKLSINGVQGNSAAQKSFGRQNLDLTDTRNLGEFTDKLLLTNAERTKLGQLRKNPTTGAWEREFSTGVWIPFGQVIQSVINPIPVTTGNSIIFYGNIAPVFADGFQILTFTVTPFLSTSTIFVMYSLMLDHSTNNRIVTAALFADNNLVGCASANVGTAGRPISTTFTHRFLPGSTAPVTFVIKVGANGGGTTYVNRGTNATLGGATVSTAIALEIKN